MAWDRLEKTPGLLYLFRFITVIWSAEETIRELGTVNIVEDVVHEHAGKSAERSKESFRDYGLKAKIPYTMMSQSEGR